MEARWQRRKPPRFPLRRASALKALATAVVRALNTERPSGLHSPTENKQPKTLARACRSPQRYPQLVWHTGRLTCPFALEAPVARRTALFIRSCWHAARRVDMSVIVSSASGPSGPRSWLVATSAAPRRVLSSSSVESPAPPVRKPQSRFRISPGVHARPLHSRNGLQRHIIQRARESLPTPSNTHYRRVPK